MGQTEIRMPLQDLTSRMIPYFPNLSPLVSALLLSLDPSFLRFFFLLLSSFPPRLRLPLSLLCFLLCFL